MEASFLTSAPSHLHLALILALWTGQRQGDLLALCWSQYDGNVIRLKQSKTGARVVIPVGGPLKEMLARLEGSDGRILLNSSGEIWTPDGFRSSWKKGCATAGIKGVTFNDLRGTAVTRLAPCWRDGGRDRHDQRSQLARCPLDPRLALPQSRSAAR